MSTQIPLDLFPDANFSFDSFIVSESNKLALYAINGWQNWPMPLMLLLGEAGTGKTHLSHAWAGTFDSAIIVSGQTEVVEFGRFLNFKVVLDDADQASEGTLFTVINMALNGDIEALVLTSRLPPQSWKIELPDLRSRLGNMTKARLEAHEDDILAPVIQKLFADKGRHVSDEVVHYLMTHHSRSVSALEETICRIDAEARRDKKDLTKYFIARFLKLQTD